MTESNINFYNALLENHIVGKGELDQAIALSKKYSKHLFHILLEQNFVSELSLLVFLSQLLHIPFERLSQSIIDPNISTIIPESFSRKHLVLPLFKLENTLSVAISNPFNLSVIEDLALLTKLEISPILSLKSDIYTLLNHSYSYQKDTLELNTSSLDLLIEMCINTIDNFQKKNTPLIDFIKHKNLISLVDHIIREALLQKVSDIHIEPKKNNTSIRFRAQGQLKEFIPTPAILHEFICAKIKYDANLLVSDTHRPQEGLLSLPLKEKTIEFRVTTLPTTKGEKIVLTKSEKTNLMTSLNKCGFSQTDFQRCTELLQYPSGLILVCGPPHSGITSTLYSLLTQIQSSEKNIMTLENPVSYNLIGINQTQINEKEKLDYNAGLKAILKQDPNIIMLDSLAHKDTARDAIQASLNGKLVLSSIPANNAYAAILNILELGIEENLLANALIGIISQYLVKTICPNCKTITPELNEKDRLFLHSLSHQKTEDMPTYTGSGCIVCNSSGYKGHTGIFEVLSVSDSIKTLLSNKNTISKIQTQATQEGMPSLIEDGLNKVKSGLISLEELKKLPRNSNLYTSTQLT